VTGEYTIEQLKYAAFESSPLEELEEYSSDWALGGISISKIHPRFSHGFKSSLSHDSRFRTQRFTFDSGREACAVIFRAFDRGTKTGVPEEFLCGWVPLEREDEATQWTKFLNQELRWRLVEKREREELNDGAQKKPGGTDKKPS
jgi:hypothetical protein